MGKFDKLLLQVLAGSADRNIGFSDVCSLLKQLGFDLRVRGSHHLEPISVGFIPRVAARKRWPLGARRSQWFVPLASLATTQTRFLAATRRAVAPWGALRCCEPLAWNNQVARLAPSTAPHGATARGMKPTEIGSYTRTDVAEILNLQEKQGKAKPYQVKQVREVILKYSLARLGDE